MVRRRRFPVPPPRPPARAAGPRSIPIAVSPVRPAALRFAQRVTRHRRIRRGERPADAAWDEFVATARDFDVGGDAAETPRALAAHLAERPAFAGDEQRAALIALRDAVERERYGP